MFTINPEDSLEFDRTYATVAQYFIPITNYAALIFLPYQRWLRLPSPASTPTYPCNMIHTGKYYVTHLPIWDTPLCQARARQLTKTKIRPKSGTK